MSTFPAQVSQAEVMRHVEATNPWEDYDRNALFHVPFSRYDWYGPVVLDVNDPRLGEIHPASKRDVQRYRRMSTPFPAIVVSLEPGGRIAVHDGSHRLVAARARQEPSLPGFIGLPKGADPAVLANGYTFLHRQTQDASDRVRA